jgi:hypothetical protein
MKKFILIMALTLVSGLCALAQSNDGHKKTEFFIGYSYGQADAHFSNNRSLYRDRTPLHGFNASAVFNVSRYIGIKADVSGGYGKTNASFPIIPLSPGQPTGTLLTSTRNSLYNVLGGVQVKDNASEKRFKPFAHALVGAAFRKNELSPGIACVTTVICPGNNSEVGLAGAFGGGLDIQITKKIAFRAFQIDYNPVKANGGVDHNIRAGIGIVF